MTPNRLHLQDVDQIADPGELDVGGDDGVVHVPEGVDVTEPHLDARAVAEVVSHGGPILQRLPDAGDQRRQQRRARHHAGQVEPFVGRVVVAADRAEAVQGRAPPAPAVVFASLAPPVAASVSSKPSSPAMVDGQLGQAGGGRASAPSADGWPARGQLAGHALDRAVGGEALAPRPRAASKASAVRRAQVQLDPALGRHHVRSRAAGDHARVERHLGPATVQLVQCDHLPGRRQDGGAALLRLDAGVRGAAGEGRAPGRRCPCAR